MKRRDALITLAAWSAAPAAFAQPAQKMHRVGFIATISPPAEISGPDPANPFARAFVHALRDLGYVAGRNLQLEMRSLEGKLERLEGFVEELARLKCEVVFIPSPILVLRAQKVARELPIVTLAGPDLVAAGAIKSFARPGGSVTGPSMAVEDAVEGKRLELLVELVPGAKRIAYIGRWEEWGNPYTLTIQAAAKHIGIDLVRLDSGYGDFAPAFARLREERVHAVMIEPTTRAYGRRAEVGALAAASGLPTSCAQGELVDHGCLMSYGPDYSDVSKRVAGYVVKILKGAKPGDLPVEAPTKFCLAINLKTAKALGISIPQPILLRTCRVIE